MIVAIKGSLSKPLDGDHVLRNWQDLGEDQLQAVLYRTVHTLSILGLRQSETQLLI